MAQVEQLASRGTVLVVDDEPHVLTILSRILSHMGYQVIWTRDGNDALQLAHDSGTPIDLLITDITMPHLSGPELARRVREMYPSVRVLFSSGFGPEHLARHGIEPHTAAFLSKPFGLAEVRSAVEAALA